MPAALVIRAAGTNCDTEMVRAFRLAGCERCDLVHLDRLIGEPELLGGYELVGFPGGFSYGDDVASGRVFAVRVRERLYGPLAGAVARGACVIGVCNGFQVLVQVGLLPGSGIGGVTPADQTVALTDNSGGRFIDQWVRVEAVRGSRCVWTAGWLGGVVGGELGDRGGVGQHRSETGATMESDGSDAGLMLPIAHGEGRFVATSESVMRGLEANGQVALRYVDNVNGSQHAVAGICDPTGRVFGLMPHPERYLEWDRHPFFTALEPGAARGDTPGLSVFKSAVMAVSSSVSASG